MTAGLFTGVVFLWLIVAGIVLGVVYECGLVLRSLTGFNLVVTIIVDCIVFTFAGVCFFFTVYCVNDGIIALYEFVGFAIGFALERLSIGKMLANTLLFVYNIVTRVTRFFKKRSRVYRFITR